MAMVGEIVQFILSKEPERTHVRPLIVVMYEEIGELVWGELLLDPRDNIHTWVRQGHAKEFFQQVSWQNRRAYLDQVKKGTEVGEWQEIPKVYKLKKSIAASLTLTKGGKR